ncbi:permease [Colwellia sp. 4_MG-2023]|uniref:permease n=1 Tax=unclassified Colwellia TaxID=196834 RepID=UPI00209042C2|nr:MULTISPECIES: permease [unclassified Colwellia]MDO6508234.1 permease [Colwellia sp. 5_MG-2023]MDO6555317.1 permease [Colwellia sp. 4_MG-2023]MDO6652731.1 permease [Colwellia sp. 3_MG-2023]MDO6665606.1 permease [Colwellia sp. 2_MG-2023]MDO6689979.1 permease [Colwellia sp. 1_MG-2023]
MNTEKLMIALNEFTHVGGALVLIIAVVSILTGFMREYIPQDKLQKKLTKHEKWGSLLGASFGMLTPFCSAAVVPVTMGMASMGASLGTVLSFLISAPLCNFIVLAMIYATFGLKITVIYLVITFTAAVLGGWLISKSPWRNEIKRGEELEGPTSQPSCGGAVQTSSACAATSPTSTSCATQSKTQPSINSINMNCDSSATLVMESVEPSKIHKALRFALALFKKIVPYVLLGALISGLSAAYLPAELVEKYVGGGDLQSIIIAAVIGVPLYLRIEMAIPLLSVLILKGMALGPALALIIGGTGASLPEIALVSAVLKRKAVIAFVFIVLTTAILGGVIFQYLV